MVNPEDFAWESGEELLTTYTGKHGFGLRFCSVCGSTICGISQGEIHGVTLGCVNGDPGVEISEHIFVASKAPWEVIPQGVTVFEEGPMSARGPRLPT